MGNIKDFEQYLIGKDRSQHTISCYVRDVEQLRGWSSISQGLGVGELAQINLTHFKKFLKSQYNSFTTINRKIASINSYYNWLHETNQISTAISISPFKDKTAKQFKGLDERQLWKLRTEIHRSGNLMHIAIFEMLIGTGIRVSELTGIHLRDIIITDRKGTLTVIGKGQAKRSIPLNRDVRKAISDYLLVRRKSDSDFLFIGQRGELKRDAINLILQKYGDRVDVDITPHMCRHTLGYGLVKMGTAITTIQQILGHENIQTSSIYTMTAERDLEEALEGVEW